jgi:hypothetical protein
MNGYIRVPLLLAAAMALLAGCGNLVDNSPGGITVAITGLKKADPGTPGTPHGAGLGSFTPAPQATGILSCAYNFTASSNVTSQFYVAAPDFGRIYLSDANGAPTDQGTCSVDPATGQLVAGSCWFGFVANKIPSGSGRTVHFEFLDSATNTVLCEAVSAPVTVLPNAVVDAGSMQLNGVGASGALPDLTVTITSTTKPTSTSLTINFTVTNIGSGSVKSTDFWDVHFWANKSSAPAASDGTWDTYFGPTSTQELLAAGQSMTGSITISFLSVTTGTAWAYVDPHLSTTESNENNNTASKAW